MTVGQRRGLGVSASQRRYAIAVDAASATVVVGSEDDLLTRDIPLTAMTWVAGPLAPGTVIFAQASAHGRPRPAVLTETGVRFLEPDRRVAPGQTIALYNGDEVLGSGIAA